MCLSNVTVKSELQGSNSLLNTNLAKFSIHFYRILAIYSCAYCYGSWRGSIATGCYKYGSSRACLSIVSA